MPKFELTRDMKYTTWWRDYFEVEAETLEEAIEMVGQDKLDSICGMSEEIDDSLERIPPSENDGNPTAEVFVGHDSPFLNAKWNNVTEFKPREL